MVTLGERIRTLRNQMGLSQEEFCRKIHVGGRHVSRYENNQAVPSVPILQRIAAAFGVTIDYLLSGNGTLEGGLKDRDLFRQMQMIDSFSEESRKFIKQLLNIVIMGTHVNQLTPDIAEIYRNNTAAQDNLLPLKKRGRPPKIQTEKEAAK